MKYCLQITFALIFAYQASLCSAESVSVALMPSGDKKAEAIVDLMEAELAKQDDLVLLDRAHIGQILAEQNIALDGLLSLETALSVGTLLKCDVFAELHYEGASDGMPAMGVLTAFDSRTGVRLCDATLEVSGGIEEIAEVATKTLSSALSKGVGAITPTGNRAITLLSVRNVDLPSEYAHLSEAFRPLLEQELLRSSRVSVLERKRLDLVNQEAGLNADLRDCLLASSVLLDLDLYRGVGDGNVRLRGMVSNQAGKEVAVVTFEHSGNDVIGFVSAFSKQLLDSLQLPTVLVDGGMRAQEADRFAAQARRFKRRNRMPEAIVAAECAHALDPKDVGIQDLLCDVLKYRADTYARNHDYNKLFDLLDRTWRFREQWMELKNRRSTAGPILKQVLAQKGHLSSEQRVRLREIQELFRQWVTTRYRPSSLGRYVEYWAESPSAWMDELFTHYKGFPEELTAIPQGKPTAKFHPFVFLLPREQKLKLMTLNKQRAAGGDPRGFIECMLLAHFMPDAFDDAQDVLQRNVDGLVNMAIQDKSGTGLIAYVAEQLLLLRSDLGAMLIHPKMLELQEEIDARRVVCPVMITYFEFYDRAGNRGRHIAHSGGYTAEVARKLVAGYGVSANRYVNACGIDYYNGHTTDPDYLLAKCKSDYQRLTRKELLLEELTEEEYPPHWEFQKKVYEISQEARQHSSIQSAVQYDNLVFLAICHQKENPRATLMEFDLLSGARRTISSIDGCLVPNFKRLNRFKGVQYLQRGRMSVGESVICLPGANGVVLFPRNGDAPRLIRSSERLPDLNVIDAIEVNGFLYLALDKREIRDGRYVSLGGMLLRTDLNGDHQTVIASSERKEKFSPLDNCDPYFIDGFLHDARNGHLYFMINGAWDNSNRGIWRLELENGNVTVVWKPSESMFGDFSPQKDGTIWFACNEDVLSWEPVRQSTKRLLGEVSRSGVSPQFTGETTYSCITPTCAAIVNDVMYARAKKPFTMLMKYGLVYFESQTERRPTELLKPFDKHAPFYLQAWRGMLVAVDEYALWLLKPSKE
jgi:hypothetical protein